jgi:hypothetical protein
VSRDAWQGETAVFPEGLETTVSWVFRIARVLTAASLLLAISLRAQARLGELSTSMTGTIAPGYSATFGNQTASTHSWALGGSGNLTGSYYSPNFLSFNIGYYLNQSRANSNFQSISNASGLDASTSIFGGSHFPGSISFSKAYNSDGNFAIPGVADYVTHGNSDAVGITWSENLPDAPSFSAGFQSGSSQYSVYGANDQGNNRFHSLNLHSGYRFAGFNLGGFYSNGGSHADIPQVVTAGGISRTNTTDGAYGFNVSHVLPLQGSISGGFNRSNWNSNYLGFQSSGTVDIMNALASVHPFRRFSLSGSASYSDNLSGQIIQQVVTTGAALVGPSSSQSSSSLDLLGSAGYAPSDNMQASVSIERRSQSFLGADYSVTSYGGSWTYVQKVFTGNLNSSVSATANRADQNGEDSLGFSAAESYSTKIAGWNVSGSFNYAQNVQTLLVTYMNSFYNYSGNARHNWGRMFMGISAAAAHTAITDQPGTTDASQSYSATLGFGSILAGSGSYSHATGQALVTGAGLVVSPVPSPVVPPTLLSLFGGTSYSFSASSTPTKHLIFSASWARSNSNTATGDLSSANQNEQFNTLLQYQYRKLNFTSGFARLEQGFSGSGTPPQVVSSYFIGASRWFKFF